MSSDPPELGKGLFGYRKSAVNQILADRDLMLRQAEGRVRSAESKVGELEKELGAMRTRNTRMDEQLDRLRAQLDALTMRTEAALLDREEAPVIHGEPSGALREEPQPVPGFDAEVPEEAVEEDDLSYGFELPGQPTEVQEYEPSLAEGPDAVTGEYEAAAAAPSSYWGAEGQGPEVQMETGPDYTDAEPRQEAVTDLPSAGGYEPQEFAYGGEQALPSAEQYPDEVDDLAYGAEITAAETEQEAEAFAPAASGYEPSVYEAGGIEAAGYEAPVDESAGAYEPPAYEMAGESEAGRMYEAVSEAPSEPEEAEPLPVGGPYPHAFTEERRPADETPVSAAPHSPPAASEASEITSRFVTEEIAGVLSAAEESAGRILERARVQSEQQVNKSSRLWEEVRAEVGRLASWREGIEPVIQTVMTKVEGIRTQIEDVPERIREALAPMADSISGIDADLAELAEACSPPLLLAPSELESDEGDADWPGSDEDQPVSGEQPGRLNAG
jgi:archaellum component FlaC